MPSIQIRQLRFALPDSRAPFPALNHAFSFHRTGLVGRNGCGKSLLGCLLAGQLAAHEGRILIEGSVRHLPQELPLHAHATIAHLLGVADIVAALRRIDNGSLDERDYQLAQDHWDCEQVAARLLAGIGLSGLSVDTPSHRLSGGERQRVALLAAWRSSADWLILDEPSNHLDLPQRAELRRRIREWPRGLILISHDDALLEAMDEIVELSPQGLRSHGRGYARYLEESDARQALAQTRLQEQRLAERQLRRQQQRQRERQQKRADRGATQASRGGQSKLLIDAQKDRSQQSQGKMLVRQQQAQAEQRRQLRNAQAQTDQRDAPRLWLPECELPAGKLALELEQVRLPHGTRVPINLRLAGPERLAIIGGNGCGKSTLLRAIAGSLPPVSGTLRRHVAIGWLDQHAAHNLREHSPCQWLQRLNPGLSEAEARTRLAQLGLNAEQATRPSEALSGGEAMRVALAAQLYAATPPQLLLLDEPDNHLDRDSREALLAMLEQYQGALLAVSHDMGFLKRLLPQRWLWLKSDSVDICSGNASPGMEAIAGR